MVPPVAAHSSLYNSSAATMHGHSDPSETAKVKQLANILRSELDRHGTLSKIKAQLADSAYALLASQKAGTSAATPHHAASRLPSPLFGLITECLAFHGLEHSRHTLALEHGNLNSTAGATTRSALGMALGVDPTSDPVFSGVSVLEGLVKQATTVAHFKPAGLPVSAAVAMPSLLFSPATAMPATHPKPAIVPVLAAAPVSMLVTAPVPVPVAAPASRPVTAPVSMPIAALVSMPMPKLFDLPVKLPDALFPPATAASPPIVTTPAEVPKPSVTVSPPLRPVVAPAPNVTEPPAPVAAAAPHDMVPNSPPTAAPGRLPPVLARFAAPVLLATTTPSPGASPAPSPIMSPRSPHPTTSAPLVSTTASTPWGERVKRRVPSSSEHELQPVVAATEPFASSPTTKPVPVVVRKPEMLSFGAAAGNATDDEDEDEEIASEEILSEETSSNISIGNKVSALDLGAAAVTVSGTVATPGSIEEEHDASYMDESGLLLTEDYSIRSDDDAAASRFDGLELATDKVARYLELSQVKFQLPLPHQQHDLGRLVAGAGK
ncbi:hypothetical protein BC828DRAFT_371991 [Blastocladiella britannica]|nr:hypothetical protein BC828DRAFT_371991 [Blastocladiella britannica]